MGEVGVELVAVEAGEVVTHDEALGERFVHGHGESASQLGESDEQHAQAVLGVHFVIAQEPEVLEDVIAQVVRFVDDEVDAVAQARDDARSSDENKAQASVDRRVMEILRYAGARHRAFEQALAGMRRKSG